MFLLNLSMTVNNMPLNYKFQMVVQARDQRYPQERFATAPVTIIVQRNRSPPTFLNEPYRTTVSENAFTGTSVYKVTATDTDLEVIQYNK